MEYIGKMFWRDFLKLSTYSRKWFTARFTFVFFVALMNVINVVPWLSRLRKMNMFLQALQLSVWFSTRVKVAISVAFINCMNVFLQFCCFRKGFFSRLTFVIFVAFINCTVVSLQIYWSSKWFATILENNVNHLYSQWKKVPK